MRLLFALPLLSTFVSSQDSSHGTNCDGLALLKKECLWDEKHGGTCAAVGRWCIKNSGTETWDCCDSGDPAWCDNPHNCLAPPDTSAELQASPGATSSCILGTQTGCDTSVALGLTNQIAGMMGKMGYSFSSLDPTWIKCSSPCVDKLLSAAASSLLSAAKSKNDYITLNSAWRSAAQQYLLYTWGTKGICDINLVATPGTSNHEGGRAIDTSNYNYWLSTLATYKWAHSYPDSDPVHFDFTGSSDLAKQNLLAFQKLWNLNNPSAAAIAEDGIYGPATASALYNAPCGGFAKTGEDEWAPASSERART